MENNINQEKYLQDMKETPSLESNKIFYNCTECNSVIEIVKINEEFIEFKCNNNHEIKMDIKEYLDKIKENKLNNDVILKNSKCNKHEESYLSYCFECNLHLCKKCLISGNHSFHYKINVIEITPNDEALKNKRIYQK